MPKRLKVFNLEPLPSVAVSRWYLSLDYYWHVYAVIFIPVVYAELQSYTAPGSRAAMLKAGLHKEDVDALWLRWALLKFTVAFLTYLLLKACGIFLKLRGIKNIRSFQLLAMGICVGLINGNAQHYLIKNLELFEAGTFFARITAPVTLTVVMLFTLSVLTSNVRKYQKNSELAEKEVSALYAVGEKQKNILEAYAGYSRKMKERVLERSQNAIDRLDMLRSNRNLLDQNISQEIRMISDSTIRDLSHEIENSYSLPKEKIKLEVSKDKAIYYLRLLNESIRFAPLNPLVFSFAYVFLISGVLIRHAEWFQAFTADFSLFLVILLIQSFGVFLYKKFGLQNIYSVVIFSLLSANLPLFLLRIDFLNFRNLVPDLSKYPPAPGLFTLSLCAVTLVGYVQQAGLMASSDLIKLRKSKIINSQNAIKPINKEIVQISRNWARHLHGSVQGQILAETVALENAQKNSDLHGIEISIEKISKIFENATMMNSNDSMSLHEELMKRISHWGGILEIEIKVAEELKSKSGYQVVVLGDIVEEMIANASRHGLATKIHIEFVRRSATQLYIKAVDNGTQFDNAKKGFGSRFFDEVSLGRWEISRSHTLRETTVALVYEIENNFTFKSIAN